MAAVTFLIFFFLIPFAIEAESNTPFSSFEMGLSYLEWGQLDEAAAHFQESWNLNHDELSAIYLAKIYLAQHCNPEAETLLIQLEQELSPQAPIRYEINFLLGNCFFKEKDFQKSAYYLERAIPKVNLKKAKWSKNTLLQLGYCYLSLSLNSENHEDVKKYLHNAKKTFKKLHQIFPEKKVALGLAQCYYIQAALLNDQKKITKGEALLYEPTTFHSSGTPFLIDLLNAEMGLPSPEKGVLLRRLLNQSPLIDPPTLPLHFYLLGLLYAHLEEEGENGSFEKAIVHLEKGLSLFPNEAEAPYMHLLLGKIHFLKKNFHECVNQMSRLWTFFPSSSLNAEALFWAARAKNKVRSDINETRRFFQKVYTDYPDSPFAPEAHFHLYSYQDYLQGEKKAIKHLKSFKKKYPDHSLGLYAGYLLGINLKKDRKSDSGRWIQKKNLTEAAESFADSERLFETLRKKQAISDKKFLELAPLYYKCKQERGLIYLQIANESQETKKQIYLEYAESLFRELVHQFEQEKELSPFQEENLFFLGSTLAKEQKEDEANALLAKLLEKYQSNKITKGYYLSRTWRQKGLIAFKNGRFQEALDALIEAENAAKGKILSVDEKLELMIDQSHCYRALHQNDQAMLILSGVINDNAISSLRIKAMFLRAELYEIQGREELARKQLEAIAKKGGDWALKAKEKLKDYGYDE